MNTNIGIIETDTQTARDKKIHNTISKLESYLKTRRLDDTYREDIEALRESIDERDYIGLNEHINEWKEDETANTPLYAGTPTKEYQNITARNDSQGQQELFGTIKDLEQVYKGIDSIQREGENLIATEYIIADAIHEIDSQSGVARDEEHPIHETITNLTNYFREQNLGETANYIRKLKTEGKAHLSEEIRADLTGVNQIYIKRERNYENNNT